MLLDITKEGIVVEKVSLKHMLLQREMGRLPMGVLGVLVG